VWPVGLTHAEAGGSQHGAWLNYFEQAAVARAAELVPQASAWRPDLVVHEETELAGPVVAAVCGARHAVHGLGLVPSMKIWPAVAEGAGRVGGPWLPASDLTDQFSQATYLRLSPTALQPEMPPFWQRVMALRPLMAPPGARERLPFDLNVLPFEHSIHLTLGTVFTHGTADPLIPCAQVKKQVDVLRANGLSIEFLGFVSIQDFLKKADILIAPSWEEPFGLVEQALVDEVAMTILPEAKCAPGVHAAVGEDMIVAPLQEEGAPWHQPSMLPPLWPGERILALQRSDLQPSPGAVSHQPRCAGGVS
jgi:hypothetical protein